MPIFIQIGGLIMRYMGSKRFMVYDIKNIIETVRDLKNVDHFYDLFMGGCSVIENINIKYRIGNDLNKYLIAFINHIRDNGVNELPEFISREQWYKVKNNMKDFPDWYVFYAMNFGSFNGNWGQGYGGTVIDKSGNEGNKILSSKNSLIKEIDKLKGFEVVQGDYRDIQVKPGSIVYLDPPYKGTNGYKGAGDKFNHNEFYDYALELSKSNFVLISEYRMPKQFKIIKTVNKEYSFKGGNSDSIECLFVVRNGWGVEEYLDFMNKDIEI